MSKKTPPYIHQIEHYYPVNIQERNDKKIIYRYMKEYGHNVLERANEVAHLTASGFIMNPSLTKVLFIYHKIYQSWGWTGGHMDGDQNLLEVAVKEAEEETGLSGLRPLSEQIMSIDILPVWGHMKKGRYVSAHLHLNAAYVLIADEEAPLVLNEEETEGICWVDVDAISDFSNEPDLICVYEKLVKAAIKTASVSHQTDDRRVNIESDPGFVQAVKSAAIPIAVHEAKSAYYKALLVKEVVYRGGRLLLKRKKDSVKSPVLKYKFDETEDEKKKAKGNKKDQSNRQ